MVNRSDSLGPLSIPTEDAYNVSVLPLPATHPSGTPAQRVAWHDGRVYRHTDGVLCGAGQNQCGLEIEGEGPTEREFRVCLTHGEEIVLAPRFRHEEDPDGDCEATPDQVTSFPGEPRLCTLHELPVVEVW